MKNMKHKDLQETAHFYEVQHRDDVGSVWEVDDTCTNKPKAIRSARALQATKDADCVRIMDVYVVRTYVKF